ncbi:MAG: ROK family protein [Bacteroidota bacterium]
MDLIKSKRIIGVDLGGTKVEAGLIDGTDIIKKKYSLIDNKSEDPLVVVKQIIDVISDLFDETVEGIGIGVPSFVDRQKGIVYHVQNIPSWKEIHLSDILQKEFNVPVYLDNDANCFAYGEYKFGQGKQCDNFVGVTIGTGMGSGIITNGHLLKDANCGSGEFGSIPYLDKTYEDYCSGKYFKTFYNTTGENLLKKAKNGDHKAIDAFNNFGNHLGNAIKTIMFSVDPKMIIIGGSVSKSKEFFINSMTNSIKKFPSAESFKNLEVKFTNTQNIAILGAASIFFDRTNS